MPPVKDSDQLIQSPAELRVVQYHRECGTDAKSFTHLFDLISSQITSQVIVSFHLMHKGLGSHVVGLDKSGLYAGIAITLTLLCIEELIEFEE